MILGIVSFSLYGMEVVGVIEREGLGYEEAFGALATSVCLLHRYMRREEEWQKKQSTNESILQNIVQLL